MLKNIKYIYKILNWDNILDSPGIVTRKDFEVVKKELEHHINKIHLIYFFIKSQSNLEENIDVLKYIQ